MSISRTHIQLFLLGPLMVITQRVTSLAYSLQDNLTEHEIDSKRTSQSSTDTQLTKIEKIPSPLEYFAFTLAFQTLMCGPVVFYSDYIKFIEGARIDEVSKHNGNIFKITLSVFNVLILRVLLQWPCFDLLSEFALFVHLANENLKINYITKFLL